METEEKIDARKLSPRELSEKRRIAMKLRDKGMPNKEVAQIVGISAQTISSYYTQYKKNGNKIFIVKNAGRPKKSGKRLSDEQEQHIVKMLVSTNPSQLQFKFALWTREAVRELILRELDIITPPSKYQNIFSRQTPIKQYFYAAKIQIIGWWSNNMPISTVGDYLARWQLASKKPIKRAYERKDALTKAWLEDIYPSIKREAKKKRELTFGGVMKLLVCHFQQISKATLLLEVRINQY
jgi:transposase